MIKRILCICIILMLGLSTASYGKDMALKDIKRIYLDYKMEIPNPYWQMKEADYNDYKGSFVDKLKDIGFLVVETPEEADAVFKCHFTNVEKQLKWLALGEVKAEFIVPRTDAVIANFNMGDKEWLKSSVTVQEAGDKILEKIKNAYDSGEPRFRTLDDGTIEQIAKTFISTPSGDVRIKDFKSICIVLSTDSIATRGMDMKASDTYVNMIKDAMCKVGYTVTDEPTKADVLMTFHMTGVAYATGFGWIVDALYVEFTIPENGYFVTKLNADNTAWSNLESMLKGLLKKVADEYSAGMKTYSIPDKAKMDAINKNVSIKVADRYTNIFTDKPARDFTRKSDYQDVGILILPIWTEGLYLRYETPKKDDVFTDIKSWDPEKKSSSTQRKMYLVEETAYEKFPAVTFMHGSITYFREDLRDIIFTAFSNSISDFKMNLKEIRMEDYRDEILSSGLESVLLKINSDYPELKQIFVVYYEPVADWEDSEVIGSYKYYYSRHGLLLYTYVSYFDLEGKKKRLLDFEVKTSNIEPMIVTLNYNMVLYTIESDLKATLLKKTKSSEIKGFTSDMKRDDLAFIQRKGTILKTADGKAIAELNQKTVVTVESKDSNKAQLLLTAYVDADKVKLEGKSELKLLSDKVLLRKNMLFENRYGSRDSTSVELIGKLLNDFSVESPDSIALNEYSSKDDRIILKGFVDMTDISSDYKVFEGKGCIKGQILKDGVPIDDAKIFIRPAVKKDKVTTDKNGYFEFSGVLPARKYNLYFVKDKKDAPERYRIKNLSQKIILNPGEILDLGQISVDDANLYDTTATITKVEELIKVIIPDASTKANTVASFGDPSTKYNNDIWGFQYSDNVEILAYFQDDKVKSMGFIATEEE